MAEARKSLGLVSQGESAEFSPFATLNLRGFSAESPDSAKESNALASAVLQLFKHWNLTGRECGILLGGIPTATWDRWKRQGEFGRVNRDLRKRMVYLIGIHYGLRKTFRDPEQGYAWIKKPNESFGGKSALDVMLSGDMEHLAFICNRVNEDAGMG